MAKEKLITSLDIGTSKIRALVFKQDLKKEGELELVLKTEENSDGVRRGTIVDVEKVSNILRNLFFKISQDLDQKINSVYVNLSGSHLFSIPSQGLIRVSRADQKISETDIQRVLQDAEVIKLSSKNKEIFDTYPREFIVDGEGGIKEPLGLQGLKLEVDVLAMGGFSPYLEKAKQAVLSSGLDILDRVPSPIAAARAVLTERRKELGVVILDIGAGVSSLAVFKEGNLIHFAVLPMGSSNITEDIAIPFKINIDMAERVKIEYGSCLFKGRDIKRKINIGEDKPFIFSQRLLTQIISNRVSEIFDEANKELKKISKEKLLPAGIVLTGGGAKLHKIVELAKDKLNLPVCLGKPKEILGIDEDISLATVCGLALLGADSEEGEGEGGSVNLFLKKIVFNIKKFLKIFVP